MASKFKITSHSLGAIRHTGAAARSVAPDEIAKGLGADEVVLRENIQGAPVSLYTLRRELETRVRSTGGRPALEGATKIQKIPLKPEDWSRLEDLAAQLSRKGVSATAGQVASVLVHKQLDLLRSRTARERGGRRLTRPAPRS